ncbi:hypothetical protein [Treponema primitia]|uniref:hypothetical protein n=1 Tax=Treponema primitia TaxID=88058 RepID=UPI00145CFA3D|nr:hypothetical protein [Treponema primitia]
MKAPVCEGQAEKTGAGGARRSAAPEGPLAEAGFRRPGIAPCGLVPMRAGRYGAMEGRWELCPGFGGYGRGLHNGGCGLQGESSGQAASTADAPLAKGRRRVLTGYWLAGVVWGFKGEGGAAWIGSFAVGCKGLRFE